MECQSHSKALWDELECMLKVEGVGGNKEGAIDR